MFGGKTPFPRRWTIDLGRLRSYNTNVNLIRDSDVGAHTSMLRPSSFEDGFVESSFETAETLLFLAGIVGAVSIINTAVEW